MSDKVRVHEIAKELGIASKEVVVKAQSMGLESAKTPSSSVSMAEADQIIDFILNGAVKESSKSVAKSSAKEDSEAIQSKEHKETPVQEGVQPSVEQVKEVQKQEIDTPQKEVEQEKRADLKEPEKVSKGTVKISPLKTVIPIKRTGLRIKKKKRPDTAALSAKNSKEAQRLSSYGKLSSDALEELANKKRAKKSKQIPSSRKNENSVSIDIFGGSMSDVSMDYANDEVVLLDLNAATQDKPKQPEEPRKPREKRPVGRNGGRRQGGFRPRQVSRGKRKKYTKDRIEDEVVTNIQIPEDIRVYEFAEQLKRPISEVIQVLFDLGMMVTKNDFLGKDEIEILAEEFEISVTTIDPKDAFNYEDSYDDQSDMLIERPPVITIMGHVDHGKTTLLDAIRESRTATSEAGGITQHVGAYTVEQRGRQITFIDTPGHLAFSAMRHRSAKITDVVIIVVASDDGVKPQTLESIKVSQESKASIIVAVTKIDKPEANIDHVKAQMAENGLTPIDWGGEIEFVGVSAKSGEGLDDLLDTILLTSEVMELRANPQAMAKAVVVESSMEKGRGCVATVIVQNGTLRVGDNVVCGKAYGKVRTLINSDKKQINELTPSQTAVVSGLSSTPAAGEMMIAMESDKETREFAQKRAEYDRQKELSKSTKASLDDLTALIAEGNLKSLKVILKADVHGSLEAIHSSLTALRNEEVKVDIISSGVGGITETDVELANNSENCTLLGFNVRPTGAVKALAKQRGIHINTYTVIYHLLDDITGMLTGMMAPKYTEEQSGQADVREVFKIPRGMVAGCMVVDGKLVRGDSVRVIRDGVVIFEGDLTSLKRFKDDVKEVGKGFECGVVLTGHTDVKAGDVIETFTKVEQKVEL